MKTHTGAWSRCMSSLLLLALMGTGLLGMARPVAAAVPGENGKIAFVTTRNGAREIYAMNADGTGQTRLTNSTQYEWNPAWSPDGSKIAYDSEYGIQVMNADGTGKTSLGGGNGDGLTWSPDGTKIAYGRDSQIWVRNVNGYAETNLTNNFIGHDVMHPAWSPDGSKIAYAANYDGDYEILVINADGSGVTLLTSNGRADLRPDWSPDGSKIVFASYRDSSEPEIYVMNADGTGQTNITNNPSYDQYPAWSPDGTKIAFASYRSGPIDIYTMNPDGTGVTRITRDGSNNFYPDWQAVAAGNYSPTVNAGDDVSGNEGSAINLSGSGSDADSDTLTYSWSYAAGTDVDADATCSFADPTATSTTITCTDDGTYTATLTVDDSANPAVSDSVTVTVGNTVPEANLDSPASASEGDSFALTLNDASDQSTVDAAEGFTYAFDCGSGSGYGAFGSASAANCPTTDDGMRTVKGKLQDKDGGTGEYSGEVAINNVAPTATFDAPSRVDSGTRFTVSLTDPDDPSPADTQAGFTYAFNCGDGYGTFGSTSSTSCTAGSGTQTVGGKIRDKDGGLTEYTGSVTIRNVAPVINSFTGPTDPRAVGTAVTVSAGFTDADVTDTHTATIDWGDGRSGAGVVSESNGSGSVSGSHTYATAGVYTLTLTVADDDGAADTETYQYVVVYDPEAGFVTGGGWITSPAGAYSADPTLSGKASFGFVSKYQKGATTPSGRTQFRFHAGSLDFLSTAYDWLVISGPKAQYKGSGTINGTTGYGFMLTANDGQVSGGGGVDRFRIKIWEKATGNVVYDNQMGDAEDGAATDAIEGGSIVIHK